MRRTRARARKRPRRATPKPERQTKRSQPMMWVRTPDGIKWVDGTNGDLPTPDAVREDVQEELRGKEIERERRRKMKEPIKFRCPACNKKISVPRSRAGERGACPKCNSKMLVPAADFGTDSVELVDCFECGRPQNVEHDNCGDCNATLPVIKQCEGCGPRPVKPDVQFCPDCGVELTG